MKRSSAVLIFIFSILVGWLVLSAGDGFSGKTPALQAARTIAPGNSGPLQFTAGGHVLMFKPAEVMIAAGDHALRVAFPEANPVQPIQEGEGIKNDKGVAPLKRVVYRDLYPGVDLVYEKSDGNVVKSTWHIAAGNIESALKSVSMQYNVPARVNGSGELVLLFETGEMRESKPVAWQERTGDRVPADVDFFVNANGTIGFAAVNVDPGLPLVIDPVLSWSTFLGGAAATPVWA